MTEVYISSVIPAPAPRVWSVIRDFNGLPRWHPKVAESRIEEARPADQVGCVRAFRLADGGRIRERLLALSDFDYACTYSILESPMPLTEYVATLRLIPVTDGDLCFAEWSAAFSCTEADAPGLVASIGDGVFQAGFDALKARFRERAA